MARFNGEGIRTNESPMDWKFDNEQGPVNPESPWLQGANKVPPHSGASAQKRPSSDMESPQKSSFPHLREPLGQKYLFSSLPTKKPNITPYRDTAAFTTPRKPELEPDDTSEPDQSSPAYADSEATPDPPRKMSPSKSSDPVLRFEGNKSEKGSTTSSLMGRWNRAGMSKKSAWPDTLHRKVQKRRRRERDNDVHNAPRRYNNDSDTEERPSSSEGQWLSSQRPLGKGNHNMGFIPSVLTFVDAHPSLPNTLSYYVQFFLNCVFAFALMYILYGVMSTIRHDINERAIIESSEILAEMAGCAREFKENRCERETRVPAMESVCNGWEKCMARDPYKVGRSRLSAGMFAEIFNSFIEPISVKALVVSISVVIGCFAVNNLTFGIYRSRNQPSPPPQPTPSQPAFLPQQHQQYLGYATPGYSQFQPPYQHNFGGMPEHQPFEMAHGDSPMKRLGYR